MQQIWGDPLLEPFQRLGQEFVAKLPGVLTALALLVVGGGIAALVRFVIFRALTALRFDRLMERGGIAGVLERTRIFRSPSDFVARLVQGFLWMILILAALTTIDSQMTRELVVRFVNYIPALATAALVLLLGSAVSKFLGRSALIAAVNAQWVGARLVGSGVRVLVMCFAAAIALEELRIGRTVIAVSFAIVFAGIVIAGAIAFGLGARDLAHDWLQSKLQKKLPGEDERVFHHL